MILLFLRRYWILIALAGVFYAGYYLRGLQEITKQQKQIAAMNEKNNNNAMTFEKEKEKIDTYYDNINTKVTYEDAYSCAIPADGLQILRSATR